MIVEANNEYVQATFENTWTRVLAIQCQAACTVMKILFDPSDGFRYFRPLAGTVGGLALAFPLELTTGVHIIDLTGEPFSGVGLLAMGINMHNVSNLTLETGTAIDGQKYLLGKSILDTLVPSTGRDYALPAEYTVAGGYTVSGRAILGIEDVGYEVTKGNGTINVKPFKNLASIELTVTR